MDRSTRSSGTCKLPQYRWEPSGLHSRHLGCILLKTAAISLPTGLAFSEIKEFTSVYSNPKHLIEEDVIEKRYATRLKILNYAAFQGCFEYKPCARNSPSRLFDTCFVGRS